MGRPMPLDVVPDSILIDDNATCEFTIESLEETHSKSGKLMYKATYRVQQPDQFVGLTIYDYFVIGTEDDPEAADPNTWKSSRSAIRFKRLLKAANVQVTGDSERDCMAANDCRFMGLVIEKEDTEGEFKGQKKNQVSRFYALGERQPGTAAASNGVSAPRPAATPAGVGGSPWRPGQPR